MGSAPTGRIRVADLRQQRPCMCLAFNSSGSLHDGSLITHLLVVLLRLLLHRVQQAHGGADLANLLESSNQRAVRGHLCARLHALKVAHLHKGGGRDDGVRVSTEGGQAQRVRN